MFAKMYGADNDQVVVLQDTDEDGSPMMRFFFKPADLGVCSFGMTFEDSKAGWEASDRMLEEMTEEKARKIVRSAAGIEV